MSKVFLKSEPITDSKHSSFPYQHDAFMALRQLEYGAIFHEQGLGKTKIAIDLILYWLTAKSLDTVIIIVKKGLIQNWLDELAEHCFIKPRILSNNKRNNFYVFNSPARIIVTHYEEIKTEKDKIIRFASHRDVGVVLDESARIKNPESDLTKVFFELAPFFKKRFILTGTPVANRPYDIWAQIFFLDYGKSLGVNYLDFKKNTDLDNNLFEDSARQTILEEKLTSIYSNINSFSVRETKTSGVIQLPDKIISSIYCEWETTQKEMYLKIKKELTLNVIKEGLIIEDNSETILKRLLRLVQVTSNPHLVDECYSLLPGKMHMLFDLVKRIIDLGEKIIIWTSFNENVVFLAKHLKQYSPTVVYGRLSVIERNINIHKFKNNPSTKILIATPGSAKEGLTLTIANNAIFFDRGFSLDDYLQAQDRIHRITQQKQCNVYNLIIKESIDEWVDILLTAKINAAKLTQNDITLDDYREIQSYDFGKKVKEILNIEV